MVFQFEHMDLDADREGGLPGRSSRPGICWT